MLTSRHDREGYDDAWVPQLQRSQRPDIVPRDASARRAWVAGLAMQATVYGLPAVLQYAQMCAQCLAKDAPGAMFRLQHDRDLAGPDYRAFRVPNVDTLYSNGWVDLAGGPVELRLPDFAGRYYTVQLLDAYSNALNVSSRTHGSGPGRYWLAGPSWSGQPPPGVTLVPVPTRILWLLMRIQVMEQDVDKVRALQDRVVIEADGAADHGDLVVVDPDDVEHDHAEFFRALDSALRLNGFPRSEWAYVRQFQALGLLAPEPWSNEALDTETLDAIDVGFHQAMTIVRASRPQLGTPTTTGWTRVRDKGAHGHNFLARAVMNQVGLAANVVEENTSFNTYVDQAGERLTGSGTGYVLAFSSPPPQDAFWSVTLYHADTGQLFDNPVRHSLGSSDPGLEIDSSHGIRMTISRSDPGAGNWLPCPPGEFFLVLRIYAPGTAVVDGTWLPPAVRPMAG